MSKSIQASITRRRFSVPARCPAILGRPREMAQRPLPSMIMAIWVGTRSGLEMGWGCFITTSRCAEGRLNFQDLFLFALADGVNLFDKAVGELLDLFLAALALVFGDQ